MKTNYGFIPDKEIKLVNIPIYPRVKLNNYIPKLYDQKTDWPSSHIKLINKSKVTKLSEVVDQKWFDNNWPDYFIAKGGFHKVKLPRFINPRLAYFMGYFYADGSLKDIQKSKIKRNKFEHKLKVGDEFLQQVMILKNLFQDIFGLTVKIRTERIDKGEHYYYIEINSKVIYRFITNIFALPSGPKTGKLKMPEVILKCPKELRMWFIRGVFDADGETRAVEFYKIKNLIKPRIRLHMNDHKFVSEIKVLLLKDFDLVFNGPYVDKNNKASCIQIERISQIRKANELNLFFHPIKKWRLNNLCRVYGSGGI